MIKKFYVLAWFLLIGSAIVSVFKGTLTEFGMVAFGLIALALVHALVLWAVLINPRDTQPR
jgi:hypothetical protein